MGATFSVEKISDHLSSSTEERKCFFFFGHYAVWSCYFMCGFNIIPLPSLEKMATISQTTFSNALSWMKRFDFSLRFHWYLFLRDQLNITQHWFISWLDVEMLNILVPRRNGRHFADDIFKCISLKIRMKFHWSFHSQINHHSFR